VGVAGAVVTEPVGDLYQEIDDLTEQLIEAEAERDRYRAVVEAAEAWRDGDGFNHNGDQGMTLLDALDALEDQ
jgi:hypothetical protein